MDEQEFNKRKNFVKQVFTPSAPVRSKNLFAGRIDELVKLQNTINTRGKHSIIYGERGVGKTSLANIISEVFSKGMFVSKISCNRKDKFESLWKKALTQIKLKIDKLQIGFKKEIKESIISLSNYLISTKVVGINEITSLLTEFSKPTLLIFDEFDTITDFNTKSQFADLIKDLSDNNPLITILIVGIGDNIMQLIGEHPSVARCLGQIKLPRMSNIEVGAIIDTGLKILGMNIDDQTKSIVIKLSQGFPYYTHLIMEYVALKTLESNSLNIKKRHLTASIFEAVNDIDQITKDAYDRATETNTNESTFKNVLTAAAKTTGDEQGRFKCNDVKDEYDMLFDVPLSQPKISYRLNKLCQEERGEILEKANKIKYRFKNPLVKAYVNIKHYNEDSIE